MTIGTHIIHDVWSIWRIKLPVLICAEQNTKSLLILRKEVWYWHKTIREFVLLVHIRIPWNFNQNFSSGLNRLKILSCRNWQKFMHRIIFIRWIIYRVTDFFAFVLNFQDRQLWKALKINDKFLFWFSKTLRTKIHKRRSQGSFSGFQLFFNFLLSTEIFKWWLSNRFEGWKSYFFVPRKKVINKSFGNMRNSISSIFEVICRLHG